MTGLKASVTLRLQITGRVQGVGFRAWAAQTARRLGILGWVRNRSDGSVEALAYGYSDAVREFVAACHEGPAMARVTDVETTPVDDAAAVPTDFRQRPTE